MCKIKLLLFLTILTGFSSSKAYGQIYIRPIFGYAIPVTGGDAAFSAGGALGYRFLESFSLETSYTRFMATGGSYDSNLIEFAGTFSIYMPAITPFFKVGGGFYKASVPGVNTDFNALAEVGFGAYLNFIPIFDLGAGLSYMAFFHAKDFIYPYLYIGFSF